MALRPKRCHAIPIHRTHLLPLAFLASLLRTSSAFGVSAVSRALMLDRPRPESQKLSELTKEQWLGLLRGAELHGVATSARIPNRTARAGRSNSSLSAARAESLVLLADDSVADSTFLWQTRLLARPNASAPALLQGEANASANHNSLLTAPAGGAAASDNSSAAELDGGDDDDDVNSSAFNGSSLMSRNRTNESTAATADANVSNQSASSGSAEDADLHDPRASVDPDAAGAPTIRQLRTGSLVAVVTADAAKTRPSGVKLQHRPARPLGSHTLRLYQGSGTARVQSMASEGGLGRALEGGDDRGSMPSILRIIVGIFVTAAIMLVAIIMFDRTGKPQAETADTNAQMRQWVRSLDVLSGDEVKRIFRERGGYDCLLMQPQAASGAVRLQGRVAALAHNVLKAPLARSDCVLFTTSASTVRLDGVRAPPTAFYAMNSDFDLELDGTAPGSTEIRIRVRGRDVALFDVASGWRLERTVSANAPEYLQDFLHVHRAPGVELPDAQEVLDFTECLLAVGAHVTCVGELRRAPTGELGLWPLQDSDVIAPAAVNGASVETMPSPRGLLSGLTSWERMSASEPCRSPRMGKVMISDDPRLLGHPASNLFSSLVRRTHGLFQTVL